MWNIGEFGVKNYFGDHRTINTIHLFVPMKSKFFGSILFQNKVAAKGEFPKGHLIDIATYYVIKIGISSAQNTC